MIPGEAGVKVEVRLFVSLRKYLPPGASGHKVLLELESGSTIAHVLRRLKIPEGLAKITLRNGVHAPRETPLADGDVLSLFPPIAGG
jgi:molybdopterin converting factor small subunit